MSKWVGCIMLICLFILSGCMNSVNYKNEDVAAIVRGEEITVGYLRLLYPDEVIMETVEEVVKAKLAEQEAKKMNIQISKELKELEETYGEYSGNQSDNMKAQSIPTFVESQASKLGMDPKEYYKKYTESSAEMIAYVNAYVSELLGGLDDDEMGIEEYNHHANELLDNLVEQNKDAIDIKIK